MNNLEFQMDEIGNGVHDLPDQEALRLENQQLRDVVNESNESMKWVCSKLADQQTSWRLEKDEFQKNFNQAKSFINNLKQQLKEKDETIHILQEKISNRKRNGEAGDSSQTEINQITHENESCQDQLSAAINEKLSLEQKCERLEKENLELQASQEEMKERLAQLQQTNLDLEQKNSNITNEKQILNKSLTTFRKRFDELLEHCQYLSSTQQEDRTKDMEARLDLMNAELEQSKEIVQSKDNRITELQELVNKLQQDKEFLAAQADVYKADFQAERHERERLNDERNILKSRVDRLELLHMPQVSPRLQPAKATGTSKKFTCPKCGSTAPDIDTLHRHVNDCIE